ncbi:hypothetical protein [Deinococcus aquiradiocola]|uniref:Ig-like domain-containing protein n=1 Tax=Deinococcus aquiradiocola TaxID=393059 RepID=A0A917UQP2_9DEIO|nr:hypothetical protein [Deinococcus aquiradiocola]GGJ76983.1 hypothetical protein GCM10008939_21330 [Deinococcus aquiradiocola]
MKPLLLPALLAGPAQVARATVPLRLTLSSVCILDRTGTPVTASTVTVNCTRSAPAPQSPLELAPVQVGNWRLSAHTSSSDGAELYTFTLTALNAAANTADCSRPGVLPCRARPLVRAPVRTVKSPALGCSGVEHPS